MAGGGGGTYCSPPGGGDLRVHRRCAAPGTEGGDSKPYAEVLIRESESILRFSSFSRLLDWAYFWEGGGFVRMSSWLVICDVSDMGQRWDEETKRQSLAVGISEFRRELCEGRMVACCALVLPSAGSTDVLQYGRSSAPQGKGPTKLYMRLRQGRCRTLTSWRGGSSQEAGNLGGGGAEETLYCGARNGRREVGLRR